MSVRVAKVRAGSSSWPNAAGVAEAIGDIIPIVEQLSCIVLWAMAGRAQTLCVSECLGLNPWS